MHTLFLSRCFFGVCRGYVHRNALTKKAWENAVRTGTRQFCAYGGMVGFKSIHLHLRQKEMMYGNDK